MQRSLTQKLLERHSAGGDSGRDGRISILIEQTLTQDATGTLVMLALEAIGIDRVATDLSVQYVDHNLLQTDNRNADDHLFLRSAARRYGIWFSGPGNGISHPLHMKYFGRPGATLLGSDSHTPAAGALGMLAIGAGGLDVAMAMAGQPFTMECPEIWGVRLTGALRAHVSAKDVILEMLRRHGVAGGRGRIIEYHGPGLDCLSVMDRHVIANMGTELGAMTTLFPSDETTRDFLRRHGREDDWIEIAADEGATFDGEEEIDLSTLEPLIASPSSPGNVVPVREVAGQPIYQAYIGSSANPGFRDFAIVDRIMGGRCAAPGVSLDINPSSRGVLQDLVAAGHVAGLLSSGARLHQAGCNGCIGMGQAPASGCNSLRTVPRNFPNRSGTQEDRVWLCSPETAAASALRGEITDPRELPGNAPIMLSGRPTMDWAQFLAPLDPGEARNVSLVKGSNIAEIPSFEPMPDRLEVQLLLRVGDDVSTDEILPAGAEVQSLRSNVPRISEFVFRDIDGGYAARAAELRGKGGHAIIAGKNYGQGSSREHAAIAPRWLGLRAVLAESFARIHRQNLINFGILPLVPKDPNRLYELKPGATLVFNDVTGSLRESRLFKAQTGSGEDIVFGNDFSEYQAALLLAGGTVNWCRDRLRDPR